MSNKLEITNLLTISTAHITESTAAFLDNKDREELVVYEKGEFGWFIALTTYYLEDELKQIPDDLAKIIYFALGANCQWLCLDQDGDVINGLPTFDW